MISKLFNYTVHSIGSDIIRPKINDIYSYLKKELESGITFMYVDNYILTLKKHHFFRPAFPTHFIVLLDIYYSDGLINMTYWDYGFRTFIKVTPLFLKKILAGCIFLYRYYKQVVEKTPLSSQQRMMGCLFLK